MLKLEIKEDCIYEISKDERLKTLMWTPVEYCYNFVNGKKCPSISDDVKERVYWRILHLSCNTCIVDYLQKLIMGLLSTPESERRETAIKIINDIQTKKPNMRDERVKEIAQNMIAQLKGIYSISDDEVNTTQNIATADCWIDMYWLHELNQYPYKKAKSIKYEDMSAHIETYDGWEGNVAICDFRVLSDAEVKEKGLENEDK